FDVVVYNAISARGLERLPEATYVVHESHENPDVILLRSMNLHDLEPSAGLKAVGRAGAGVNNIPVGKLSERGIPVFNTPGANANAVEALVDAGLLLSCRNIAEARRSTCAREARDEEVTRQVAAGKKRFAGTELPGMAIGIAGLGAIGRSVAEVCLALGM